jgi:hypothetical protein
MVAKCRFGHELPPRSMIGAAERPLIADTAGAAVTGAPPSSFAVQRSAIIARCHPRAASRRYSLSSLPSSGPWQRSSSLFCIAAFGFDHSMPTMPTPRRFLPPWSIEESSACFIVRDGNKQALAYVYFENEPGRRSSAKLLTRDEAFLIALNIAKLQSVPRQILKNIPRPPNTAVAKRPIITLKE